MNGYCIDNHRLHRFYICTLALLPRYASCRSTLSSMFSSDSNVLPAVANLKFLLLDGVACAQKCWWLLLLISSCVIPRLSLLSSAILVSTGAPRRRGVMQATDLPFELCIIGLKGCLAYTRTRVHRQASAALPAIAAFHLCFYLLLLLRGRLPLACYSLTGSLPKLSITALYEPAPSSYGAIAQHLGTSYPLKRQSLLSRVVMSTIEVARPTFQTYKMSASVPFFHFFSITLSGGSSITSPPTH